MQHRKLVKRVEVKARRGYNKLGVVVGTAMALSPLSAFATSTDMPATLDGAEAWVTSKIAIGIAICLAFTLGHLAFKGTKLPRKA